MDTGTLFFVFFPHEGERRKPSSPNLTLNNPKKEKGTFSWHNNKSTTRLSNQLIIISIARELTDASGVGLGSITFNVKELAFGEIGSNLVQSCGLNQRLVNTWVPKVFVLHQGLVEMYPTRRFDCVKVLNLGLTMNEL
jgi:hypothetical protein